MATAALHPAPLPPRSRLQINPLLVRPWIVPLRWKSLFHPLVIGALMGVSAAVVFDRFMADLRVLEWPAGLAAVCVIASAWPAWRAMIVCLRHRSQATWVHWLMTPLTPRQLLQGLWLDAMAPALVMLATAGVLMALSWTRHTPFVSWVLEGSVPDFGMGAAGRGLFAVGVPLVLIALGCITNTLIAVVIALRFRTVMTTLIATVTVLVLALPGALLGLMWVWFVSGWGWIPRAPLIGDPLFDWANLAIVSLVYWTLKGLLCFALIRLATRRLQRWCLGEG